MAHQWTSSSSFLFFQYFFGGFFGFCSYNIQHCFICRPSDSTVQTDAGIKPRTVATGALAVLVPWSMDRGPGCPLTSLEPRTSNRVLVLGEGFLGELDRVIDLVEGFLGELKLVLALVEGFLEELKLALVIVEFFFLLDQQLWSTVKKKPCQYCSY